MRHKVCLVSFFYFKKLKNRLYQYYTINTYFYDKKIPA
ncbi:hypothetical protein PAGA_a1972 [Pseudoalteromonas agarivorans DSM 14585]|uniref:Uncharacterized protein n=1 Tax=Pseudoalteromonas agarivorans DSM 14585 TaxID=1312369 RepID=A0ACA8DWB3_9GAMM|nr:hypothetical protein PAGA_a1972 [Pseudoalteromonas agarivorans DSM 14585]